jgi:acetylxylan esterase
MIPRTLLTTTLLLLTTTTAQNTTKKHECVDGLKIFVGRGTGEPITLLDAQGLTGTLTKNITDKIPSSHAEGILYDASYQDPSYFQSNANGTALVREAVLGYGRDCPDGKMALIGYSQVSFWGRMCEGEGSADWCLGRAGHDE